MDDLNWSSFSEKYHLKNDRYIKDVELLQRLQGDANYPVILYPQLLRAQFSRRFIIDSSKKDKNHIYFDDLLNIAKSLDLKGDEWQVLIPPKYPEKPCKSKIPMTRTEYHEPSRWGCLVHLMIFFLLFLLAVLLSKLSDIDAGVIICIFVVMFVIFAVGLYRMVGFSEPREVWLTKKEIKMAEAFAELEYQLDMEKYTSLKDGYEEKRIEYEHQVHSQAERLDGYLPLIASTMFKHCLKNNSKIDDCGIPPQRGAFEDKLFYALMKEIPSSVKVDKSLGAYAPDLVLCNGSSCPIDIEIDEPYEYKTKKEIHYIGCGDEERNDYFVKNNWFVLRFSENQIQRHLIECVDIVKSLARFIESGDTSELYEAEKIIAKIREPRWTKEKSRILAIENYRERT